jgi:hypothetical protein
MTMRFLVLALLVSGCGPSSAGREPDEFTGCASDEHWRTFDDQEPLASVSDAMSPVFTMPTAGATVPAASKPIVAWSQDPNDVGMADGNVPHTDGVGGCNMCCPEFNIGALSTLHLPPVSGDVYDLQFTVGGKVDHRVITTLQEWTPPDATWAAWKGQTVTLKIYRMTVLRNDVKQGPYTPSAPFTFTVGS